MKRDLNLIRELALLIESADYSMDYNLDSASLSVDGYDARQIAYNCKMMIDGGLIEAISTSHMQSTLHEYRIGSLTWKGCDFIDAARDSTIWNKTTKRIKDKATAAAFDVVLEFLKSAGRSAIGQVSEWVSQ